MSDLFAPGEPAPATDTKTDEPAPPAPVENADQATGTEMDTAADIPEMSDDAIQQALAAAMRGEDMPEELEAFGPDQPRPGNDLPAAPPATDPASASPPVPGSGEATTDATDATTPPASPATPPAADTVEGATHTPPTVIDIPGLGQVTPEQATEIAQVYQWAQGLSVEQAQAITDLLSGGYSLTAVPPGTSAASGPGVSPPAGAVGVPAGGGTNLYAPSPYAPPPVAPPADLPAEFDPSQYADPELARLVHAQQKQMAELATSQQQFMQQQAIAAQNQMRQEQARLQAEADAATNAFTETHKLDPTTANRLVQTATQLQIIPSLMAKHGNDPRKAMTEALEVAYWTDPQTRAAAIQAQVEEYATQAANTDEKKRRAAALNGGGGAVQRTAPAAQPLTKEQREAAMIAELTTAMNGSQS